MSNFVHNSFLLTEAWRLIGIIHLAVSPWATQTSEKLFESDSSREKIAQCSGWTAAHRIRFIQIPWTLSITRVEEILNNL
jgi:hypothetical protein